MYADDSLLIVSGKDVKKVEHTLEMEMNKISKWLQSNKLSLHLGKTESIVFGSKCKLRNVSEMKISCNDVKIEAKSSVKYLGVVLDQDMSGETTGSKIVKKVNGGLKFLYRKSEFLNFKNRKLLCSALLQSRFDYGHNVYYRGLREDIKTKLQTAQNKIIRFILGFDSQRHLYVKDFMKVRYLNVKRRFDYLTLNMMYDVYNSLAPSYLCTFKRVDSLHDHGTRGSKNSFVIPQVKGQGSLTFMYNGAKLWNKLPDEIKTVKTKDNFKKKCKSYKFEEMEQMENDQFVY